MGMGLPPKKENEGTLVINLYKKNLGANWRRACVARMCTRAKGSVDYPGR